MTRADFDGHLCSEDLDGTPERFYMLNNARIGVVTTDSPLHRTVRLMGAQEVTEAEYKRADALRRKDGDS